MDEVGLVFANRKLEHTCSSGRAAKKELGSDSAKKLERRIKYLQATGSVEELLQGPGKWHPIFHDWPGHYSGRLADGRTILVKPHSDSDGAFVWFISCVGHCYKH